MWAIWTVGPTPDRIIRRPTPITVEGVQHPASIWTMWDGTELAAQLNAYPLIRTPILTGHRPVSTTYEHDPQERVVREIVQTEPVPVAQSDLLARNAALRYAAETSGLTLANGVAIRTDRESQSMIDGAIRLLEERVARGEDSPTTRFKAESGWATLDLPALKNIGFAVGMHVAACFAKEEAVAAQIDSSAISSLADLEAAWQ